MQLDAEFADRLYLDGINWRDIQLPEKTVFLRDDSIEMRLGFSDD